MSTARGNDAPRVSRWALHLGLALGAISHDVPVENSVSGASYRRLGYATLEGARVSDSRHSPRRKRRRMLKHSKGRRDAVHGRHEVYICACLDGSEEAQAHVEHADECVQCWRLIALVSRYSKVYFIQRDDYVAHVRAAIQEYPAFNYELRNVSVDVALI